MRHLTLLSVVLCLGVVSGARAQQWDRIDPPACRRGDSVEVRLAGAKLGEIASLHFSRRGLQAKSLGENRFRITAEADAALGSVDVWALGKQGVYGPRRMRVAAQAVVDEQKSNDAASQAQRFTTPALLCGRFEKAADEDWFTFTAKAGEAIAFRSAAWSLDSDARIALTVFHPEGDEILHDEGRRREGLYRLMCPVTGEYQIRLTDRSYATSNSRQYTVEVNGGAVVWSSFPTIIGPSSPALDVLGFQLPGGAALGDGLESLPLRVSAAPKGKRRCLAYAPASTHPRTGETIEARPLNQVIDVGRTIYAMVIEQEVLSDRWESAPLVTVPCHIAGRFDHRHDVDWYRFQAKKGDSINIVGLGDRLGKRMDLDMAIHQQPELVQFAFSDFAGPKGWPATAPLGSLDPQSQWKAPADGEYRLMVRDLFGSALFGPDRTYEIVLRRAKPDFHVFALVNDGKTMRGPGALPGGDGKLTILVSRQDGYSGALRVSCPNPPDGLKIAALEIGAKENTKSLQVRVDPQAKAGVRDLELWAAGASGSPRKPVTAWAVVDSGSRTRIADGIVFGVRAK